MAPSTNVLPDDFRLFSLSGFAVSFGFFLAFVSLLGMVFSVSCRTVIAQPLTPLRLLCTASTRSYTMFISIHSSTFPVRYWLVLVLSHTPFECELATRYPGSENYTQNMATPSVWLRARSHSSQARLHGQISMASARENIRTRART